MFPESPRTAADSVTKQFSLTMFLLLYKEGFVCKNKCIFFRGFIFQQTRKLVYLLMMLFMP